MENIKDIHDIQKASYILVPIDEVSMFVEDDISIKELLKDIEENVELEENPFSTMYLSGSACWANYGGTSYHISINDRAEFNGKKVSHKRQASIQILKIILQTSSLRDKVSVKDYGTLKINLKTI